MDDIAAIRKRLGRLAWLLDSAIMLPGTRLSVGLDALIGLVPGLGDAVGVFLSAYIVQQASQLGVPRSTLLRMVFNIAIEGVVGLVPLAGDLFDAIWKANVRNVELLDAHFANPRQAAAASRGFVFALTFALLVMLAGTAILGFLVLRWVVGLFSA